MPNIQIRLVLFEPIRYKHTYIQIFPLFIISIDKRSRTKQVGVNFSDGCVLKELWIDVST